MVTLAHPNLVICRGKEILLILEMTIPYNSPEALSNARQRKRNKENYQLALSELDRKGFKTSLTTLEVGTLGHSPPQTHSDLKRILPRVSKSKIRHLFDEAGKISITCSHTIFRARTELDWNTNGTLQS